MNYNLSLRYELTLGQLALDHIFRTNTTWDDDSVNDVFDLLYGVCYEI